MKRFCLSLCVFALALAASAGTASASRIFLSTTSTSPALINPTMFMSVGASAQVYLFWQPTTDDTEDYEQLSGLALDLVSDTAIFSRTSFAYVNPTAGGSARWGSTNIGTSGAAYPPSGTYLTQNSNAVKVGGSNLGFFTTSPQGYYNVGGSDVWRLATITFTQNTAGGISHLRLGVGGAGISFQNTPTARSINFGFGDAAIQSNSFGSVTTSPEMTIGIPEPGTFAMLGMGVAGLLGFGWRSARPRC